MRVLIVEDEVRLAEALGQIMAEHRYLADLVYTGPDGLEYGLTNQYDVIVLDVMLPGMDGLAVARGLREAKVSTPILMLTALDSDEDKIKGLDAGADDYVTKPFSTDVLLARIRANLRRTELDGVNTSTPQTFGDLTLDMENSSASINGTTLKLRSKELQLLFALAEREGMLCRRTWLTQKVWKEDYLSTSRTIDVHIRRLRSVLDEYSNYRFIHTVHGMGYRFEPIKKTQE